MEIVGVLAITVAALGQSVLDSAPPGRLEVEIVSADGRVLVGERYVGLVPAGSRWREPAFEALVPPGESLPVWRVPAGRYRLLCSEKDHWWAPGPEFEVASGDVVERRCELRPLVPLRGEVVSARGDSVIANARLGHVHGFLENFRLKLSPLGESHARSQRTTKTDEEGRFVLLGPEDGRVPLWIEADGYSPRSLEPILFPRGGRDLGEIRLEEGGALRVALAETGPIEREGYSLTLVPGGEIPSSGRQWARLVEHVWAKPLPESRPVEVEWPSLPPGGFEVWLVPSDLRSLQVGPRKLGEVSIERGREATAALKLPQGPPERDAASAEGSSSSLRLQVAGSGQLGTFSLRRWADGWEKVSGLVRSDANETLIVVPEGCRPGRSYVVETSTSISRPLHLTASDCEAEEPVEVSLFPAGRVEGRFLPPKGAPAPTEARLVISSCERQDPRRERSGVLPVGLGEDGSWATRVPAGCLRLEAQFEEFGLERWQEVVIEEGEKSALDTRRLSAGATLFVRSVSSADGRGIAGAEVNLVREDDLESEVRRSFSVGELEESALPSARSDARGWAVMKALDSGTYRLKIQTERRSWPHFTAPFELRRDRETVLEYLEVPEPGRLEVEVQAEQSPGAEDTSVMVAVSGAASCGWIEWVTMTRPVSGAPRVHFPEIPSGTWLVTLLGSDDQGRKRPLGKARVDIGPGQWKTLTVKVDRTVFHGIVTYQGEPIQGVLQLNRRSGADRERVRTSIDEDGLFSIPVRSAGRFTARVVVPAKNLVAVVPDVVLEDPSQETQIELPEGRLGGVVVDAEGEGVQGVQVRAEQLRERESRAEGAERVPEFLVTSGTSGDDGRFEIEAVAPGEWTLQAVSERQRSRSTIVGLAEKEVREGLVLRLEEGSVRGRLVDTAGSAVRRGSGRAEFLPPQGATPEILRFRSGENGEFELEYPGLEDVVVNLAVSVSGYPAFAVRRLGSDLMDVRVPGVGGTVDFAIGEESWSGLMLNQLTLVGREGEYLPLSALKNRLEESKGVVTLQGLAIGTWRLVRAASLHDARLLVGGQGASLPALASFEVGGGERVHVSVRPRRGKASRSAEDEERE